MLEDRGGWPQQVVAIVAFNALEWNGVLFGEARDGDAAERRDVAPGAERAGEVASERTNIGALLTRHLELGVCGGVPDEGELIDGHGAFGELDRLTGTRQIISALAVDEDSRERRRPLHDGAG